MNNANPVWLPYPRPITPIATFANAHLILLLDSKIKPNKSMYISKETLDHWVEIGLVKKVLST